MTSNAKGKQRERSISISIKSSNHSPPPTTAATWNSNHHRIHNQHHHPSNPYPHPTHSRQQYSDLHQSNHSDYTRPSMRATAAATRESSVSSSIAAAGGGGAFHPNSNHPYRASIPQNRYPSYSYRTPTPSIMNAGPSGARYPPSISSRSDLDLVGDGPPIGLVRPPPTISSDGCGLNNLDGDGQDGEDGEEEGDGQPPLIFHCKKCGKVIGDTWSWVTARTDMRIVVLATVTDAVSAREELLTSKDAGPLTGSPYTVVDCSNCDVTLGKIYRMTPRERDDLRDAYSLNVDALSIYPVGSANQSVGAIPPDAALRLTPGSFPAPTSAASNEAAPANPNGNASGSGHAPATFHELSQLRMLVMTMGERLVKLEQVVETLKGGVSPSKTNLTPSGSKLSVSGSAALGSNSNTPTKSRLGQASTQAQPKSSVIKNGKQSTSNEGISDEKPSTSNTKSNPSGIVDSASSGTKKNSRTPKSLFKVQSSSSGNLTSNATPSSNTPSIKSSKRKKTNNEDVGEERVESNSGQGKTPKRKSRKIEETSRRRNEDETEEGDDDEQQVEEVEQEGEETDDFDADPAEAFEQDLKSPRSGGRIGEAISGGRKRREVARGRIEQETRPFF